MLIGIVARLVPIKKHEIFLSAAALILRDYPDTHFIVVGDGERRQELEALARDLHVADHVHFLGWRGDLSRIYADLDIVALTSANEGLPVSLIEGMAAGKPVVAYACDGAGEVCLDGNTGHLIEPGDLAKLETCLARLAEDPAHRSTLGQAGRALVNEEFTVEQLVDGQYALYLRLRA